MSIQLDSHPKASELHLWADYAELLCLFNLDGVLSKSDFEDSIDDGLDLGETEYVEDNPDLSAAENKDKFSQRTDDIFRNLAYRQETFEDFYPFYLDDYGELCLRTGLLKPARFYIFLLLASNLGRLKKSSAAKITNSFEVVCAEALRRVLPEGAQVHIFGPRHGGRYTGKAWKKVGTLAADLGEMVIVSESDFDPRSTGDEGLDIVAWIPTGDENSGKLLLFAQCACGLEWKGKQASSDAQRWRQMMTFKSPPSNLAFIPFHFRKADGTWYVNKDITTLLFDRQRLVHALKGDVSGFSSLPGLKYVSELLKTYELEE